MKVCAKCKSKNIKQVNFFGTIDSRVECLECKTIGIPIEVEES